MFKNHCYYGGYNREFYVVLRKPWYFANIVCIVIKITLMGYLSLCFIISPQLEEFPLVRKGELD